MRAIPLVLAALILTSTAAAQERSLSAYDLPREVERRLRLIVDDPATRRFDGPANIAAAETIVSNVVAFTGPLTVEGRIEGELIVIGGNIEFRTGAVVTGDVTVVAGDALNTEVAQIGGTITTYGEGFGLYHRGERVLSVNTRRRWENERDREWRTWGHSTLALRTGINYNRVEGLPLLFGPVIQTGGRFPTRIEALGIVRTGSGDPFDADRMGYQLRLEQFIGLRSLRVGAAARSVIEPIEAWNLSNLEASLATFLLHEDQRDYFEREGWGVYVRYQRPRSPLDVSVGFFDEEHASQPARDPWTLFGAGAWRRQPLVAEGTLRAVSGRVVYDRRNDDDFPTSGFYAIGSVTRGVGGSLSIPAWSGEHFDIGQPRQSVSEEFQTGLLDLRLYRPVTDGSTLAFRAVAGGSLDGKALPAQFQHALGGAGTLPGYRLLSADCGARRLTVIRHEDARRSYFPHYGCDRFAMGSVEYRGGFDFDFGGDFDFWGHGDKDWDWRVDANPNWMVFLNAGQGWALGESALNTGTLYDAGAGLVIGDFGVYAAVPLNGRDRDVNIFVRLGARF